jgi:hypothetical protein
MKALQELVPNANKVRTVSIKLDCILQHALREEREIAKA